MLDWWSQLTTLNRVFYGAALFFSVFFVWQMLAALIGLGSDDLDVDHPVDADHDLPGPDLEHDGVLDAAESTASFKLASVRSILTFFLLFTWGTALYLNRGDPVTRAMGVSLLWGLAGMVCIALVFYGMRRLTETGTANLNTAVGQPATVYLNIPADGTGEVRVMVSGVMKYIKARSVEGTPMVAGTPVRVRRRLDQTTIEVEHISTHNATEKEDTQ
jgi:hypothetical protein